MEQFFRENKLEYEKVENILLRISFNIVSSQVSLPEIRGWKYWTKDNRLCIYACDFFSVTPEMIGAVDAVYDRGALEAVNVGDRQGYVKLMQSLLGKSFR